MAQILPLTHLVEDIEELYKHVALLAVLYVQPQTHLYVKLVIQLFLDL